GAPDLQGVWDFRSLTPMERPEELADDESFSPEQAAEFAAETIRQRSRDADTSVRVVPYNDFLSGAGPAGATGPTALLVVPPGGLQVRCILGFNSGPPMAPSAYNNNLQVFQTEDTVVLFAEMNHEARVVPLDGRAHLTDSVRQWTGDSRGRWDGDTLVVETRNFLRETNFQRGATTPNLTLTERLTRVDADTLRYDVTVDDPTVWTRPWTYSVPMQRNPQPVYEYACHEGNYGLYNILAGAAVAGADDGSQ
ncbi:MAG: hypothetical protein OXG35_05990, partial [Acidobacteria bacterium]|nr:hypothetical protein [Acidobacteriota bacterium]